MNLGVLETILCALIAALAMSVVFRRFQLPVILGYFLVGVLMGPNNLGLIPDESLISDIAEFGIVFLMFTVGLEFSRAKLFSLKKSVFLIGGLQVISCVVITTSIGMLFGMTMLSALVVGGIAAMSSTAIVVKQLNDQGELHTTSGLNAVGILLFQDLAVIPFIILIVGLSTEHEYSLPVIFLWAFLKGAFAILLIAVAGRWFLKPIFSLIAKTRSAELFTLTVLLITLTAAWLTNILGLSYAFGAFLAGIMLSETEFRHQIEIEIRPFRDILLGLFFISIGMLADVSDWPAVWVWITLLLAAITLGKMLLIILISRLSGSSYSVSMRTGLVLAQGGEFGFAILTLALSHNMLPESYEQVILAALLISIVISPLVIFYNKRIAEYFLPKQVMRSDKVIKENVSNHADDLQDHVIICGFGRVGRYLARVLEKAEFPYIGLDINEEIIRRALESGTKVIYGDASHPGILHAAGIARAKALVISFDKMKPAIRVLSLVRREFKDLPIIVRCKDQPELAELKKYGATKIVAEIFEESLTLSQHLLHSIQMPLEKVSLLLEEVRSSDYDFLRKIFSGSFNGENGESLLHENLIPIQLKPGAFAIGHKLGEFDLRSLGVDVIAVRRDDAKPLKPNPTLKLNVNDIVVVYGSIVNIEDAERKLLLGE